MTDHFSYQCSRIQMLLNSPSIQCLNAKSSCKNYINISYTYNNFLVNNFIAVTHILNDILSICKVNTIIPIDQEPFPPSQENFTKANSANSSNSFTQMTVETIMNFRQFLLRQMYNEM